MTLSWVGPAHWPPISTILPSPSSSLTMRPPTRSLASSSSTDRPAAVSWRAATRPARPAPTTRTSAASAILIPPVRTITCRQPHLFQQPRPAPLAVAARVRVLGLAASALNLAPAAGPVVRDDLAQHGCQSLAVDPLAFPDRHRPRRLVGVTRGDDARRVGHDCAVIQEQVHVVFRRQQRADVAVEYEVGLTTALDRLRHLWIGGVNEVAQLLAHRLLPVR